jgi:poly(A) polymerase
MTPRKQSHESPHEEDEPIVFEADEALLAEARTIGQDALRVISKLQRSGHEAYLVGGCVRDLLIGRAPKDFDVATSAHPRQVKRLFRNGRIIGRRFRLVHVRFGREIIETATFRREPPPSAAPDGDLLIVEDNEYGTAAEDARRRDFTVNGLFLDPFGGEILDFVGGLDDLDDRVLRTIGDPQRRMPEDPVRILRAIKFSTRLDFRIDDETWSAMRNCSEDLQRSAPPRILEEILRLLRSGTALGAFKKLGSCGALAPILPHLANYLSAEGAEDGRVQGFYRLLESLDADIHSGSELSNAVLVATMVHDLVTARLERGKSEAPYTARDIAKAADNTLAPFVATSRLPKRDAAKARRLLALQGKFTNAANERTRPLLFCLTEDFEEALSLFRIRTRARGMGWDIYEGWVDRARQAESLSDEALATERKQGRRKRRRRRKRR